MELLAFGAALLAIVVFAIYLVADRLVAQWDRWRARREDDHEA